MPTYNSPGVFVEEIPSPSSVTPVDTYPHHVQVRERSVLLVGDSHLTDGSSTGVTKLGPRLRCLGWSVVILSQDGLDTVTAISVVTDLPPASASVFSFGSNDAAPWKEVGLPDFERSYRRLLGRAVSQQVVVLGPPPVAESGAGTLGRTNSRLRRYSECARRASAQAGGVFIPLIDLLSVTEDLAVDGLHLNDRGYEKVTAVLLSALDE